VARQRFQQRVRRKRQWVRELKISSEMPNNTALELLRITASEYEALGFGNPTVVRIRGQIHITPDSTTFQVANEVVDVGVGIITVRGGVGAGVISPIAEPNESWMFWRVDGLKNLQDGSAGVDLASTALRYSFDVKSMRVLRGQDDLVMTAENSTGSDPHVFVSCSWSVLLQE